MWNTNGEIRAKLAGEKLVLKAKNSGITGSFEVRNTLVLSTSNAAVEAEVALVGEARRYEVSVGTTNALVMVEFVEQPRGRELRSGVETTNGLAEVRMHREYEGALKVRFETRGHAEILTRTTGKYDEWRRRRRGAEGED
mgnify:FL=1